MANAEYFRENRLAKDQSRISIGTSTQSIRGLSTLEGQRARWAVLENSERFKEGLNQVKKHASVAENVGWQAFLENKW